MLRTLLSRCSPIPRSAGVGVLCNRIGLLRSLHSDVRSTSKLRNRKKLPLTYAEFIRETDVVFRELYERRNGLRVRADGFVALGQVINMSERLRPIIKEQDGKRLYEPRFTMGQIVRLVQGDPESKVIWWIRRTELPEVPEKVDQAKKRILPGTGVRNAIYKATTEEWEHIRVHGLRPPAGQEMIVMSPVDKIDEDDDDKITSHVYIFIDMEEAMKQGVEFFLTKYIQVVSPGDASGVILPRLFKDAVRVDSSVKTLRPIPQNDCNPPGEQGYELQ